jgi:RimJ/RimL family protein N-acetyltransferase
VQRRKRLADRGLEAQVSHILETDRLRLRPVSPDDLDHIVALYGDPEVMRYIGTRGALTREEACGRLDFMVDHWRRHGFGMWSLFRKDDGAFVGRCGMRYMDSTTDVELGYTLVKACWGQGFATEASRAVVRYALDVMKMKRLVAIADPENTASVNVMKKIGMTFERVGHYYGTDCVLYALAPPT